MPKLTVPGSRAVQCVLVAILAGCLKDCWARTVKSDQFQRTNVEACLTNVRFSLFTLKSGRAIYPSQCALKCELLDGCSKFLHCENPGKNCFPIRALGIVRPAHKLGTCVCYAKLYSRCENGGLLKGDNCECLAGYYGDKCESIVKDCADAQSQGFRGQQAILVKPESAIDPFPVLCDLDESHAFTFIQQRKYPMKFDNNWAMYTRGFGSVHRSFWLGFEQILLLLNNRSVDLKIGLVCDLAGNGTFVRETVRLRNFSLTGETDDYRFQLPPSVGPVSGEELRNSFVALNGQPFSTADRDSRSPACRNQSSGGWWFGTQCQFGNLNAPFLDHGLDADNRTILLMAWPGLAVQETFMKIKT